MVLTEGEKLYVCVDTTERIQGIEKELQQGKRVNKAARMKSRYCSQIGGSMKGELGEGEETEVIR